MNKTLKDLQNMTLEDAILIAEQYGLCFKIGDGVLRGLIINEGVK